MRSAARRIRAPGAAEEEENRHLHRRPAQYREQLRAAETGDATGTEEEMAALNKSYEHLCKMRDEIVELGIVPPVAEWNKLNSNL